MDYAFKGWMDNSVALLYTIHDDKHMPWGFGSSGFVWWVELRWFLLPQLFSVEFWQFSFADVLWEFPCLLIRSELGKLQKRDTVDQFHCQDHGSLVAREEFPDGNGPSEGDCDARPSCSGPGFSTLSVPLPQTEEELKEIWAATVVQTAYRALLVFILSLTI